MGSCFKLDLLLSFDRGILLSLHEAISRRKDSSRKWTLAVVGVMVRRLVKSKRALLELRYLARRLARAQRSFDG